MAIIRTIYGDTDTDVEYSHHFMDIGEINFSLPFTNELVQSGAFNSWRPICVRINDGDHEFPGSSTDISCWSITPQARNGELSITAYDAAKWLDRRTVARITNEEKTTGQHLLDIISNVVESREERIASGIGNQSDSSYWSTLVNWPPLNQIKWGNFWDMASAASSIHSVADRSLFVYMNLFNAVIDPTSVKIRLFSKEQGNIGWRNKVQISKDNGATWLDEHIIPVSANEHESIIDVTNDTTWLAADLNNIRIRLTVEAGITSNNYSWYIYYVSVQCDFDTVNDHWPILPNNIDLGGKAIVLPDERKTIKDWLDYLVDQSGYGWFLQSDLNILGYSGLSWKETQGEQFATTTYINGEWKQVASIETGQLIGNVQQAGFDGTAIFTQVRVTASGQSDVVVRNDTLANDIGIHEYQLNMGDAVTATDMTNAANEKLAELANPVMLFKFQIPRLPNLWGSLRIGNTAIARFKHAPIKSWSGIIRILSWDLDETAGIITISALSVSDDSASFQALGNGYNVQGTIQSRKYTPQQSERKRSVYWQWLISKISQN